MELQLLKLAYYFCVMNKKTRLKIFLGLTIISLAALLFYWLKILLQQEYANLKNGADVALKETISTLQKNRFEKNRFHFGNDNNNFDLQDTLVISNANSNSIKSKKKVIVFTQPNKTPARILAQPNIVIADSQKRLPYELIEAIKSKINESMKTSKSANDSSIGSGKTQKIVSLFGQSFADSLKKKYNHSIKIYSQKVVDSTNSFTKIDTIYQTNLHSRIAAKAKIASIKTKPVLGALFYKDTIPYKDSLVINAGVGTSSNAFAFAVKSFFSNTNFNQPLPIKSIDSAYKNNLAKINITLPFAVNTSEATIAETDKYNNAYYNSIGDTLANKYPVKNSFQSQPVLMGLNKFYKYQASFNNVYAYLLSNIKWHIIVAVLLLLLVSATMVVLYKNLQAQVKLGIIKNEFISNITHEFKTPIATVHVAIEAMRNFGALNNPEKTAKYLDISANELQRLSLLVDNVLKLSMLEKQEIEFKQETFCLNELLQEVVNTMKPLLEKNNGTFNITAEGTNWTMHGDRLHLSSVIYNLVENAIKYSKPPATIDITISDKNNSLTFMVKDNGIGIPKAYQNKIFQKFFRVPAHDTHNIKGHGLGLSYVQQVVVKHNGNIHVVSTPGVGSTFTVVFKK